MTASNAVADYYKFGMIRRCNDFLTNIQNIEFADAKKKDNMIGQVKTIRAYTYFNMNWQYGGVPIIDSYETAEEAQVPRNTEEEVKKYIYDELDAAIPMLDDAPAASGYIAKVRLWLSRCVQPFIMPTTSVRKRLQKLLWI